MDDYCYAKMATSCQRQHERESETSRKSPTEIKTKPADGDVQQLIGHPEERSTQSGGSSTLSPEPPHIKEEEEELWITQEGDCLRGPQEADYEDNPRGDNLFSSSDSEAEDEDEEALNSDTDYEDIQQLIGHPEELPPQSGVKSTLRPETPQSPHIKKEEEELWITQERECLLGPQEADLTKFPLSILSVKTEDDEEKPQPDNLLAPLSDSEAEDGSEEPLSSETDSDGRSEADSEALCRSFTRSPRVVLGFLLTVLMIVLTPRDEILRGASDRGRLSVVLYVFHFLIIAPTVDFFTPSCLPIVDSLFPVWCSSTILFLVSFDSSLVLAIVEFGV
ncbi:uncharacterized protein LOC133535504 isoform X2 [Nerophis ophidion]|uniref:uncharacterized protein LOC133535504 isoform X2 n=1 Tax=Nerophis ophidion TaxID=159077 RepID=UPI002AE023E2|nr:uncharacterized protein LOC133535504 isoform X2 [Nerophis ophidion]